MLETMGKSRIGLSPTVRHRAVGEDGVLVHLESGRVIVVNEVGLYIIQLLVKSMSSQELVDSIVAEFEVSNEQAQIDLDTFLEELNDEQILEVTHSQD